MIKGKGETVREMGWGILRKGDEDRMGGDRVNVSGIFKEQIKI